MKKKLIIILMSTIMIGSIFTLNGCGKVDLTQIGADETTLSAEMEKENLSDGWIKLSVRDAGDTVELEVADNGKGMSQEKITQILSAEPSVHKDEELGIGVDNVISRLKLYFGIDHVCDIESEGENKGTSVKLYIPKKGLE